MQKLCQTRIKVLRPSNEIRFVDILAAYRTQPQFNREVSNLNIRRESVVRAESREYRDFLSQKSHIAIIISGLSNGAITKFNLW